MPRSKYYKILGLQNNATETEIRKKYRKLVMQYHPDRNDSPHAKEKFIVLQDAYEILMGKKEAPAGRISRARTPAENQAEEQRQKEQRAKEAQARFKQQQYDEYIENEKYYQILTKGIRWKTMRVSAIIGIFLSFMVLFDFVLPNHYEKDDVYGYNLNYAHGLGGTQISLIKTEKENAYWVEHANFDLYGRNRPIYVESSWFFHNPIRIISVGKVEYNIYNVNFNFYSIGWLLFAVFLIPAFTMYYKRKNITFTVLFHLSYYAVNSLMLLFLFTGDRWAHVLTLGFL